MRKPYLALLCLLPLISCGGDSETQAPAPVEDVFSAIETQEIDGTGGMIGDDTVVVTVPAGALSAAAELKLERSTEERPFGQDGDAVTYRLRGVPAGFTQPLTVRIAPQAPVDDVPYAALGTAGRSTSEDGEQVGYRVVPAVALGDTAISFTIDPQEAGPGKDNTSVMDVIFLYLQFYDCLYTEHQHFLVAFPSGVSTSQAAEVGVMLEQAYTTIHDGLGFDFSRRTDWPIDVTLKELSPTVFGYQYSKPGSYEGGYLELNTLKLGETDDLRRTIGHEFFHIAQTLYYPPDQKVTDKFLWLEEACSVWSEVLFSANPDFVSLIRDGNQYEPYWGLADETFSGKQTHGYGMSAAVKYLAGRFGTSIVESFFDGVHADRHPADCMLDAAGAHESPALWWSDFLARYSENGIYSDMAPTDLALNFVTSSRRFTIDAPEDTLKTFSEGYLDLSGRMFRVDLDKDTWDPDRFLELSLAGDGGHGDLTVWSYGSGPLVRLSGPAAGTVRVENLQELKDANRDLLVLVTNGRAEPPYTTETDITLKVHLKGEPAILKYDIVSFRMDVVITRQTSDGPYTYGTTELVATRGAYDGFVYTGTHVNVYNGDRDSLVVRIDPLEPRVESFEVWSWKADNRTDVPVLRVEGGDIPYIKDGYDYLARVDGTDTCGKITHVSGDYDPNMNEYWYSYVSYACEADSYVQLKFE